MQARRLFARDFSTGLLPALEEEQGTGLGDSQRYQYCIIVDGAVLESCVHHATRNGSYVIIILASWKLYLPNEMDEAGESPEGCTLQNEGGMRANFRYLIVNIYYYLRGRLCWSVQCQRPSTIV